MSGKRQALSSVWKEGLTPVREMSSRGGSMHACRPPIGHSIRSGWYRGEVAL
jgi:hypothetical protein